MSYFDPLLYSALLKRVGMSMCLLTKRRRWAGHSWTLASVGEEFLSFPSLALAWLAAKHDGDFYGRASERQSLCR
ncbi:hypothetical protein K402DRAFT_394879 [Aulographum hederae CBS 113979]|uniref:Uncharacterized protein n=1 Tax=Aulographum hederae CBS 113979 TaxID=1176131 RepID=A0A6G1GW39_9PEZI|nr:hypothetical protein K402DRAFT_394879 [Aulographum hederae CBS 113979]